MIDPRPPVDREVERAIALAQSEAEVERAEGVSWLLKNPDRSERVLANAVLTGDTPSPELFLRLLAAIGRQESLPAMEAALTRGHPGESFYAAQALAGHPHPNARAILERAYDRLPAEAKRGLESIGFRPGSAGADP